MALRRMRSLRARSASSGLAFSPNGFKNLESIRQIRVDDLKVIGMPLGHALRIRNAARENLRQNVSDVLLGHIASNAHDGSDLIFLQ